MSYLKCFSLSVKKIKDDDCMWIGIFWKFYGGYIIMMIWIIECLFMYESINKLA